MNPGRRPPQHPEQGTRAAIPWATHRAGYEAHIGATHHGRLGSGCRTCIRYLAACTVAWATENGR